MWKKLVLGVIALLVVGLGLLGWLASSRPDTVHVETSREIALPRMAVTPWVTELRSWREWAKGAEPVVAIGGEASFSPTDSGVGAFYAWTASHAHPRGRVEITGLEERDDGLVLDLIVERFDPAGTIPSRITLVDRPGGTTRVTWMLERQESFGSKLRAVLVGPSPEPARSMVQSLEALEQVAREPGLRRFR